MTTFMIVRGPKTDQISILCLNGELNTGDALTDKQCMLRMAKLPTDALHVFDLLSGVKTAHTKTTSYLQRLTLCAPSEDIDIPLIVADLANLMPMYVPDALTIRTGELQVHGLKGISYLVGKVITEVAPG